MKALNDYLTENDHMNEGGFTNDVVELFSKTTTVSIPTKKSTIEFKEDNKKLEITYKNAVIIDYFTKEGRIEDRFTEQAPFVVTVDVASRDMERVESDGFRTIKINDVSCDCDFKMLEVYLKGVGKNSLLIKRLSENIIVEEIRGKLESYGSEKNTEYIMTRPAAIKFLNEVIRQLSEIAWK